MNLHGLAAIGTQMGSVEKPNQIDDYAYNNDAGKQGYDHSNPSILCFWIGILYHDFGRFSMKRKAHLTESIRFARRGNSEKIKNANLVILLHFVPQ